MQDRALLWLFVLRCRDLFLLCLIAVALLTPHVEQRFGIAAVLAFVVLPYNTWLKRRTRRTGRVPVLMAFGDPLLCAGIALQFPDALAAAMVAATMDLAIAAATFRRRVALQSAVVGAAAFTAVGVIDLLRGTESDGAAVAVPAYCIAAVTTALMVSTLVQREQATTRQLGRWSRVSGSSPSRRTPGRTACGGSAPTWRRSRGSPPTTGSPGPSRAGRCCTGSAWGSRRRHSSRTRRPPRRP